MENTWKFIFDACVQISNIHTIFPGSGSFKCLDIELLNCIFWSIKYFYYLLFMLLLLFPFSSWNFHPQKFLALENAFNLQDLVGKISKVYFVFGELVFDALPPSSLITFPFEWRWSFLVWILNWQWKYIASGKASRTRIEARWKKW